MHLADIMHALSEHLLVIRYVTVLGLELRRTLIAGTVHYGVFSLRPLITRGTKFGPFRGRVVNLSEIKTCADNSFMWEVSASSP